MTDREVDGWINTRRVLLAHRDGARVLATTSPVGPHRLRIIEQVLYALVNAKVPAAQIADASFVFNAYVVGSVLDETLGRSNGTESFKRRREQARRWFKSLPKEAYPTLIAFADKLLDARPDRRFELGVGALLDGFELRAKRRP